jgi:hypothetical protein
MGAFAFCQHIFSYGPVTRKAFAQWCPRYPDGKKPLGGYALRARVHRKPVARAISGPFTPIRSTTRSPLILMH